MSARPRLEMRVGAGTDGILPGACWVWIEQKFCGLAPSALGKVSEWMKDKRAAAVLMDCKQSSNQKFFLNDLIPVVPQRIQK